MPELRKNLILQTSIIGELLNDFTNNVPNLSVEMAKTEPILQAIKKRLKLGEKGKVNEALKLIKNLKTKTNSSVNEDDVRAIFNSLHGINSEIEQWEKDKEWSA